MIELKNITKKFSNKKQETTALSNVSLLVPEGKIYGIIGVSGAGKSTLIRCVNLLEKPTGGQVVVNGQDLMKLSKNELTIARRSIGMIFQHFNLLSSRTVFENVAFPLELCNTPKKKIKERVLELLSLVGLEDKVNEYPSNLSGGQKQRVAIARTLATNPKVLLCDEATSALDPGTTRSILKLLKDINLKTNITILLITHEMNVVKDICDEVAVINQGKLIEQGEVSEIFSHPKQELTKQFIQSSLHIDIPSDYKERLSLNREEGKHPLLRLEFTKNTVDSAILSESTKLFEIHNNIISAQMDYAGGVKFGFMLTELSGSEENEIKTIEFFKNKNIKVEVLGYV